MKAKHLRDYLSLCVLYNVLIGAVFWMSLGKGENLAGTNFSERSFAAIVIWPCVALFWGLPHAFKLFIPDENKRLRDAERRVFGDD